MVMGKTEGRARLFMALDLPATVREGIAAWGREELSDPALRPVGMESLHITLAFLGDRPRIEFEPLAAILADVAGAAPRLELSGPVSRPPRERPRLFALEVGSAGAVELEERLRQTLVAARLYEPEKRAFWPHVTVARVRTEGDRARRPAPLARQPGPLPAALLKPFLGVRATLYRSELQPQGVHYIPLAQVELPVDGRQ